MMIKQFPPFLPARSADHSANYTWNSSVVKWIFVLLICTLNKQRDTRNSEVIEPEGPGGLCWLLLGWPRHNLEMAKLDYDLCYDLWLFAIKFFRDFINFFYLLKSWCLNLDFLINCELMF